MADRGQDDLGGDGKPDEKKPDALDDILGAHDEGVLAAYDILRSDGLSVNQAVARLIGDDLLTAADASRFAFDHKDRPIRKKRGGKPSGRKGNGKAGDRPASFTASEDERLTTWITDIAADLGYNLGHNVRPDIDIRADGSWFIFATTNSGGGSGHSAFDLIVHVHGDGAEDYASAWLKSHPQEGSFFPVDAELADSGHDQRRKIEAEDLWNSGSPATGTVAETWLAGLGFSGKMLSAVAGDIAGLRVVNRRSGGPTLLARVTDQDLNTTAIHIQPINPAVPTGVHEPRNKSGNSNWLSGGMIRLGNHGAGAPTTLYMAPTLAGALALRAAGLERVAAPPHKKWTGRAAIPPEVTAVVLVGDGSEFLQAAVPRLLGQGGIKVKRARLKVEAGKLDPVAIKASAEKADGALWQRGEDEFFRALFCLDDLAYGRAKLALKKIDGMPSINELNRARQAARKEAVVEKKAAEDDLVIRAGEAKPATELQNLPELLDDIVALLERYVSLPPTAAWMLALFAVYTSVFEEFEFAMRVWLYSVEPESGKTTLGMLVLRCCPRRKRSDNITPATFHRFIGTHQGYTIFLNEANAAIADGGFLVDLICSGAEKESSVDRTEKDEKGKFATEAWSVYAPVILAGLEDAAKQVQSRAARIIMEPPTSIPGQPLARKPRVTGKAKKQAGSIARRVARWAEDNRASVVEVIRHVDEMEETDHTIHNGVHPLWLGARQLDKLLPLFVIAKLAGADWPDRMEQAARVLSPTGKGTLGHNTALLLDCLSIIHAKRAVVVKDGGIVPEDLHSALLQDDAGTWREFVDPKRPMAPPQVISSTRLGKTLGAYQVLRREVTEDGKKRRLYPLDKFLDAFRKYLVAGRIPDDVAAEVAAKIAEIDKISAGGRFSANKPGDPVQPLGNKGVETNSNPARKAPKAPGSKTRKPLRRKGSHRVAGFETEKTGNAEKNAKKAPKTRNRPSKGAGQKPRTNGPRPPSAGEDI